MELFHENGCLTDAALRAVVDGTLDETARLEVCEHLSFCDACLLRYTALLDDDMLLTPEEPVAPGVMQRIREKTMRVLVNRYTRAAAVAVLALALWSTGVFSSLVPKLPDPQQSAPAPIEAPLEEPAETTIEAPISAGARVNGFFRSAGDSISAALYGLADRLTPAPAPAADPAPEPDAASAPQMPEG